jgi:hypothetical protein
MSTPKRYSFQTHIISTSNTKLSGTVKPANVARLETATRQGAGSQQPIERLVWRPEVHTLLFQETCHYFLLRVNRPDAELPTRVREFISRAQIKASCVYLLYGYFDVLIRVWATPTKYGLFDELTQNDLEFLQEIKEFKVKQIRYGCGRNAQAHNGLSNAAPSNAAPSNAARSNAARSYAVASQGRQGRNGPGRSQGRPAAELSQLSKDDLRDYLGQYRTTIEAVSARDEREGGLEEEDADLKMLIEGGIALPLTQFKSNVRTFKFYIALTHVDQTGGRDEAARNDILTFLDRQDYLYNVSLYQGIGFADFLVKAVVRDFADVLRCIEAIIGDYRLQSLRPTTYLIADLPEESDVIDYTWVEPAGPLLDLVAVLGHTYATRIRSLSSEERLVISNLYQRYYHLSNSDLRAVFLGLFQARLDQNAILLSEKMLFIVQLESLLLDYLHDVCRRVFHKSWYDTIKRIVDETPAIKHAANEDNTIRSDVSGKKQPFSWFVLSDTVLVLNKLAKRHPQIKLEMDERLGPGWVTKLEALRPVRNDLAHGRIHGLYENPENARSEWPRLAGTVLEVGDIYNALVNWKKSGVATEGEPAIEKQTQHEAGAVDVLKDDEVEGPVNCMETMNGGTSSVAASSVETSSAMTPSLVPSQPGFGAAGVAEKPTVDD